MQINNLTLSYLLEEIKPLAVEGFVNKIQEISKGIFKLKVHTKKGSKDLIVTDSAIFFTDYSFGAKKNPNSFFAKLQQLLSNKKIISISQHEFDRVLVFEFSDFFLIMEFFHKSNVILTDKNQEILFVKRREIWKDRSLRKGDNYKFPSPLGQNPKKIAQKQFFESMQKSNGSIIKEILSSVNMAPLVAEGVLFDLKIDKKSKASELTQIQVKKIVKRISDFYTVKKSVLKPVKFKDELLPFAFSSLKNQESVKTLSFALDKFYCNELLKKPAQKELKEKDVVKNRLKFSLKDQKTHQKKFESKALDNRLAADFIYENFIEIQDLLKAVKTSQEKEVNKKEVMYKINSVLSKKSGNIKKIVEIDLSKKEIVLEVKSS